MSMPLPMPTPPPSREPARCSASLAVAILLAATSLAAASACSSPAHPRAAGGSTDTASTASVQAQSQRIWNQFAACMRSHGVANFPDPVINQQGEADFGSDAQQEKTDVSTGTAGPTCAPILDHLPPSVLQTHVPVSAADLASLRQYAQCLRRNGIPEWPDPKSDGSFPLARTALGLEGKSTRYVHATQACKLYWDKGITVS